jgi:hypothetical protein
MEHMLLQPYASHPDSWSTYVDYAGDSHMATHHVDVEPQNYQVCTAYLAWLSVDSTRSSRHTT